MREYRLAYPLINEFSSSSVSVNRRQERHIVIISGIALIIGAAVLSSGATLIYYLTRNQDPTSSLSSIQRAATTHKSPTTSTLPWSTNVSDATKWIHYGVTVAGGRGQGNRLDQLNQPWGLFVTDDQTVYVADFDNHRVMEWKRDAATGRVVAGGNGAGDRADQIKCPTDVIVDDESDSLIICDTCNKRGVRWPRQNGTRGETIVGNIECRGLAMDRDRSLYVVDFDRSAVIRYRSGQTLGSVVAGGNRCGNQSDQLCFPRHAFVDRDLSLYVTGSTNLVMKWTAGAIEGTAVGASSLSQHYRPQLTSPNGIIVDQSGGVYVSDDFNGRILRLSQGGTRATVVVGENRSGNASYQIDGGGDISFDRDGNLYVVDIRNHRVQRFSVDRT